MKSRLEKNLPESLMQLSGRAETLLGTGCVFDKHIAHRYPCCSFAACSGGCLKIVTADEMWRYIKARRAFPCRSSGECMGCIETIKIFFGICPRVAICKGITEETVLLSQGTLQTQGSE